MTRRIGQELDIQGVIRHKFGKHQNEVRFAGWAPDGQAIINLPQQCRKYTAPAEVVLKTLRAIPLPGSLVSEALHNAGAKGQFYQREGSYEP